MKWSKEKEQAFEKVINYVTEKVSQDIESGVLPRYVGENINRWLMEVNDNYEYAKKSGIKALVGSLATTASLPITMFLSNNVDDLKIGLCAAFFGAIYSLWKVFDRREAIERAQEYQEVILNYAFNDGHLNKETGELDFGYINREETPESVVKALYDTEAYIEGMEDYYDELN